MFLGLARPQLAFRLVRRLAVEPWSEFRAKMLGGEEHLGWTSDTYKLTEISNAIHVNTEITRIHGSKAKAKKIEPSWTPPRVKAPAVGQAPKLDKLNLADFDVVGLLAEVNNRAPLL